ncbi:MAG: amino acid permease [Epsilonproteobacteria bacterium]|nr:amino acid transporter [Campylobacterota bacterium]NPA56742.1 amino acid permease [Campylobacterota bacterium]
MERERAFGLWSAVFLGIGAMVGIGIFIVIGEAGAIAGNLVIFTFILGGLIALLAGYSLAKLAIAYPSRGGVIEYIVQEYGEGYFSGTLGVLFYLAQIVGLAAVVKSFGVYASTYFAQEPTPFWINTWALAILTLFVIINLIGASFVAKSENIIVITKLTALTLFVAAALLFVDPQKLLPERSPHIINLFYALGLVFFAYQGFSVITNSVEDMEDPQRNMVRAMMIAIGSVMVLYTVTAVAVIGNLPLEEIIRAKDYALAEAAKPIFGEMGFKIMAAVALISATSAINASLYGATQISYDLARKGELPKIYEYNIFHSTEGLIVSALLIVPMVLFLQLDQIATTAAIVVLLIQGFVHLGHLWKIGVTGANPLLVVLAGVGAFTAAGFALLYTSQKMPLVSWYVVGAFVGAFLLEILLRLTTRRIIKRHIQ